MQARTSAGPHRRPWMPKTSVAPRSSPLPPLPHPPCSVELREKRQGRRTHVDSRRPLQSFELKKKKIFDGLHSKSKKIGSRAFLLRRSDYTKQDGAVQVCRGIENGSSILVTGTPSPVDLVDPVESTNPSTRTPPRPRQVHDPLSTFLKRRAKPASHHASDCRARQHATHPQPRNSTQPTS